MGITMKRAATARPALRPAVRPNSGGRVKPKSNFNYRPRTAAQVQTRINQSGTNREGFIQSDFTTWAPKDGVNKIRILPATWDDAEHYGLDVFVHYGIGPDNSSFVCPMKFDGSPCPVCEEREKTTDEDMAKEMRATKRVAMWIINRAEESKGPQVWCAPWTLDKDISSVSIDTETGEVVAIDHPDEGYDVHFTRSKKGGDATMVEYTGVMIARRASPIFDDEEVQADTLSFVTEHPIPSTLLLLDYEHIQRIFGGASGPAAEEGEAPVSRKPSVRPKTGARTVAKEEPADDAPPTWEEVHALDEEGLGDLAEQMEVQFPDEAFDSAEAVADFVCDALGIPHLKSKSLRRRRLLRVDLLWLSVLKPEEGPQWQNLQLEDLLFHDRQQRPGPRGVID